MRSDKPVPCRKSGVLALENPQETQNDGKGERRIYGHSKMYHARKVNVDHGESEVILAVKGEVFEQHDQARDVEMAFINQLCNFRAEPIFGGVASPLAHAHDSIGESGSRRLPAVHIFAEVR